MRRVTKTAVASVTVAVVAGAFFLAPVAYWFTSHAGPVGYETSLPVYRSLRCATLGLGDVYAPDWFGFSLGCQIPAPIPF